LIVDIGEQNCYTAAIYEGHLITTTGPGHL